MFQTILFSNQAQSSLAMYDFEPQIMLKVFASIFKVGVHHQCDCEMESTCFQLQNSCEKELFINSLLFSARFLIYRCKYSGTKPNMLQYFNLL